MRKAISENNPVVANELDLEWHTLLIDAARNRYLSRTWRTSGIAFLVWSPEREIYPFSPEKWAVFELRHAALLAALRSSDEDKCIAAVRNHIADKLSDLHQWLAKQPTQNGAPS
jgi:DNA-binding GntR family transcriptional regulator